MIRTLTALALAAASMTLAAPAHAGSARGEQGWCVTGTEWEQTHRGMSRHDVQVILDGPGRPFPAGSDADVAMRHYPICGRSWKRGRVVVIYTRDPARMWDAMWLTAEAGTIIERLHAVR